jgi:ParB family chromosome partitioning protein
VTTSNSTDKAETTSKATKLTAKPVKKSAALAGAVASTVTPFGFGGEDKQTAEALRLKLSQIKINPKFDRRKDQSPETLETLYLAVKTNGMEPIIVRPHAKEQGKYEILSGHRRFSYAQKEKWDTVPAVVWTHMGDDTKALAFVAGANSEDARFPFKPLELAHVLKELSDKGMSPASIAKSTGLDHQKVRNHLALLEAPSDTLKQVDAGSMSMTAGLVVAKMDPKIRKVVAPQITPGMGREQITKLAKEAAKEAAPEPTEKTGKSAQAQKGPQRDAALTSYRSKGEYSESVRSLAYMYLNPKELGDDIEASDLTFIGGALAFALWYRNEITDVTDFRPYYKVSGTKFEFMDVLEDDTATAKEKSLYKRLLVLIRAESDKFIAEHPPTVDAKAEEENTKKKAA